jgi:AcrR family transcriptional regulator
MTKKQVKLNSFKSKEILQTALKLFLEKGFKNVTVREIVEESHSSMGNLYFHFKNKMEILKFISHRFLSSLRLKTEANLELPFEPVVKFAIDLKLGLLTTLEDEKIYELFILVKELPENRKFSIENKRFRLIKFFGERIPENELDTLAIALQGISDAYYKIRNEKELPFSIPEISNLIIKYNLQLIGFPDEEIKKAIEQMDNYLNEYNPKITFESVIENMID